MKSSELFTLLESIAESITNGDAQWSVLVKELASLAHNSPSEVIPALFAELYTDNGARSGAARVSLVWSDITSEMLLPYLTAVSRADQRTPRYNALLFIDDIGIYRGGGVELAAGFHQLLRERVQKEIDPELHQFAAALYARYVTIETFRDFLELEAECAVLQDDEVGMATQIAFARLGQPLLPMLNTVLHDHRPRLRRAALYAIQYTPLPKSEIVPFVEALTDDSDPDIRALAHKFLNVYG